ncbi:MAG: VOC family protein [Chitinophagaceae bacterium]|nr:VOC family protein [Chitinophagaceae bacterium]
MKFLFPFLTLLMLNVMVPAQSKTFGFTFNHQALSVTDLDKSVAFYKTVLGLEQISNRTQMAGISWFSLGEGKELHLVSIIKEEVKINKAVHIALTTPQFDAFIKHLEANHIAYSDWPGKANTVNVRADGIKQIYLQDPDGYWIEVNSVAVK